MGIDYIFIVVVIPKEGFAESARQSFFWYDNDRMAAVRKMSHFSLKLYTLLMLLQITRWAHCQRQVAFLIPKIICLILYFNRLVRQNGTKLVQQPRNLAAYFSVPQLIST